MHNNTAVEDIKKSNTKNSEIVFVQHVVDKITLANAGDVGWKSH